MEAQKLECNVVSVLYAYYLMQTNGGYTNIRFTPIGLVFLPIFDLFKFE